MGEFLFDLHFGIGMMVVFYPKAKDSKIPSGTCWQVNSRKEIFYGIRKIKKTSNSKVVLNQIKESIQSQSTTSTSLGMGFFLFLKSN